MMRLIRLLRPLLIAFCVATVTAQAILVTVLWLKGGLSLQRWWRVAAVAYDIDLGALRKEVQQELRQQSSTGRTFDARVLAAVDLDTRLQGYRTSLAELLALNNDVLAEQRRSRLRTTDFDALLARLEQEALSSSLLQVRRTLEVMQSKQAKDQLLRMLDDQALDDVVTIVKSMQLDKRRRIFSEFKTPEEAEQLRLILRQLRQVADLPANGTQPTL